MYQIMQFNKMLQCYAGSGEFANPMEIQALERMNRQDFHTFVLSKKMISDDRSKKKNN